MDLEKSMRKITISKLRAYFNYEDMRWRLQKKIRHISKPLHSRQLLNKEFTIISNNCWGGVAYEYYNVEKQSPTVGLFFVSGDYIKFCRNLRHYIESELTFINPCKSCHYDYLKNFSSFGSYPIGKLDDIEIMFLHYHTLDEAREKWIRRCKRIKWDKLIFKFNDQNGCTQSEAKAFLDLPYRNKLFFTIHKDWQLESYKQCYIISQHTKDGSISMSHEPYGDNRFFNLTKMINEL